MVGASGMTRGESNDSTKASSSQAFLGVMLVLAGSAVNAFQGVCEEHLLKGTSVHPLEVVGWEGVFGSMWCIFVLLPIAQVVSGSDIGGVAENSRDTLMMMTGSAAMTVTILGYAVFLALMNNYSQVISKHGSAVIRMQINTLRVILVWLIDLFIYYAIPSGDTYGEKWDNSSWIQLGGFIFLILGTYTYMRPTTEPESKKVVNKSPSPQQTPVSAM